MSRADPQEMSGATSYPPTTCLCSDQGAIHKDGKGKCQNCGCTEFRPVAVERFCQTCGAWLSKYEVARLDG